MWRDLKRHYKLFPGMGGGSQTGVRPGVIHDALPSGSLLQHAPPPMGTSVGRLAVLVLQGCDLPLDRVAVKRDATLDNL